MSHTAIITYTNTASVVVLAYNADATSCIATINGKVQMLTGDAAIDFEGALMEAGYWVI